MLRLVCLLAFVSVAQGQMMDMTAGGPKDLAFPRTYSAYVPPCWCGEVHDDEAEEVPPPADTVWTLEDDALVIHSRHVGDLLVVVFTTRDGSVAVLADAAGVARATIGGRSFEWSHWGRAVHEWDQTPSTYLGPWVEYRVLLTTTLRSALPPGG